MCCCRASGTSAGRADDSSVGGSRKRKKRQAAAAQTEARSALFRHVRFNRVHVAITYRGIFNINDAKVRPACVIPLRAQTCSS